jgi:hypothetical protein
MQPHQLWYFLFLLLLLLLLFDPNASLNNSTVVKFHAMHMNE